MCKELVMTNTTTGATQRFFEVSNLVVPGYNIQSFSAIFDLAELKDVSSIKFDHSKGTTTISTRDWQPTKLID